MFKLGLALVLTLGLGCSPESQSYRSSREGGLLTEGGLSAGHRFTRLVVDDELKGPAFATADDVDGDGHMDLVVTYFGDLSGGAIPAGSIVLYRGTDTFGSWEREVILSEREQVIWPNDAELHDIDGDGDLDVLVGSGFLVCEILSPDPCGGLLWMEQTATGWVRHDIVRFPADLFYHRAVLADLNGDGIDDLVTVGERKTMEFGMAETQWFRGVSGPTRFDPIPIRIGEGLGSIPSVHDIDGDGDLDIVSAEYFTEIAATAAWFECIVKPGVESPTGRWKRHVIDADHGPAIQLSLVDNLLGDGRLMAVSSNHTNTLLEEPWESAVYLYEIPEDPRTPWPSTKISKHIAARKPEVGQASPGIFGWGDADGDGDVDVVVSGDADPRLFLLEQQGNGEFKTWTLDENLFQAGGMKIVDLNGDGANEIIATGYEDNLVVVYVPDPEGRHPLRESRPFSGATYDLEFELNYGGESEGNLILALFDGETLDAEGMPTGAPKKYMCAGPDCYGETGPMPSFPTLLRVEGLASGSYRGLAFIDTAPVDVGGVPGPEDPAVWIDLEVSSDQTVTLDLDGASQGGGSPSDLRPGEQGSVEVGPVSVTVFYEGPGEGVLISVLHQNYPGPPMGMPQTIDAAAFPASFVFNDLGVTQLYASAFLDLPPASPTFPGPEDPIAVSDRLEVGPEGVAVELVLALP